jgi:hypothetical protein
MKNIGVKERDEVQTKFQGHLLPTSLNFWRGQKTFPVLIPTT